MTEFIKTRDGQTIAYNSSGNGAGLVLLHGGLMQSRSIWNDLSYIKSLQTMFKVVTLDIRGARG